MTLKEILSLEEENPCPGCPVCAPREPRRRGRHAVSARWTGAAPSDGRRTAAPRDAEHEAEGA